MATLKEIRAAFPQYANVPDDVLSEALFKKYGEGQEKADFLLELQGRGPRISPIRAGIEGLKGAAETAVARGAQALGAEETAQEYLGRAEERAADVAARYQPVTRSFEDVNDPYTFYRYLLERGGESAPQMLAQIGGGVAGLGLRGAAGLAGLALTRGVSPTTAAALGSTAVGTGAFTGYNIQRQMEEGTPFEETSLGAAGATALGQSALDTLSLATILRGFPGLSAAGAGTRVAAAARRAVESGATEALTESGQQALEILQANPDKLFEFNPEVQNELKEAAIAGGLLGGALGGVGGAATFRRPAEPAPAAETPAAEQQATTEVPVEQQVGQVPVEGGATIETAGAPAIAETPAVETPAAVEPPPAMAPAPRIETTPAAAVEPVTAEPAAVEPGATVEPVTTEPAPASFPTREAPERPSLTLPQFIASLGGIQDVDGELAARNLNRTLTGRYGPLVRQKGLMPEDALRAAIDAGYYNVPEREGAAGYQPPKEMLDRFYDDLGRKTRDLEDQRIDAEGVRQDPVQWQAENRRQIEVAVSAAAEEFDIKDSEAETLAASYIEKGEATDPLAALERATTFLGSQPAVTRPVPPSQTAAARPIPARPAAAQPSEIRVGELPRDLLLGRPTFTLGSKAKYTLNFPGSFERAIFHASKKNMKPKDQEYVQWLRDQGLSNEEIQSYGKDFRKSLSDAVNKKYRSGPNTGTVDVPRFGVTRKPVETKVFPLGADDGTFKESAEGYRSFTPQRTTTIGDMLSEIKMDFDGIPGTVYKTIRDKLEKSVGTLKVHVVDAPDMKADGWYSSEHDHVVIQARIFDKPNRLSHVVMHEAIHAATVKGVQSGRGYLHVYLGIIKSEVLKAVGERPASEFGFSSDKKVKDLYAFQGDRLDDNAVAEFLSEALSNRRLMEMLQTIPVNDYLVKKLKLKSFRISNMWKAIIESIRRFFQLPDNSFSALEAVLSTYDPLEKITTGIRESGGAVPPRPLSFMTEATSDVDLEAARKKIFADVPETRGRFRRFVDTVSEMYKQGGWRALAEGLAREASDKYAPLMNLDKRFVDFMKAQGNEVAAGYDQTLPLAARLSSYVSMLDRETTLAKLNTLLFQGGLPVYWTKDGDPANLEGAIKIEGTGGGLSFIPELQKAGKLMNFAEYAVAKRALGTYAARNLEFQLSPAEAQAIVDLYDKDPAIVQAYKQYQEFNKALIDLNVAAGRISEKDAKSSLQYADFFPFHRFADDTGRLSGPINTKGVFDPGKIMKAKGGTELLQGDPVDMILKNAQFWLSSAQKNIAARKVYTMSEAVGEARQLSFTDVEKEQLADALYDGDMKEAGRHIQRERMLRPGEAEGSYYVNGVERRVALKHPDVAEALLATEAPMPDLFKGVFGTFTQGYRELVTRSPEFILSNLIRDSLGMPITSRVGFNILRPVQMMYQYMKNKENNKTILALMQWGAIGGYKTIPGLDNASKLLNPNFNPTKGGVYVPESGKVLTDILAKVWNTLGELSDASDAAPRAAIYEKVLEATGDEAEAAFRAQNAINYRKQGRNQLLRYLVVMVPFLNGRIQGLDVTARAFGSKEALIHTGIRGGYLLGAAMALQALVGDDEEYLQLPEYVRYGSLPVPLKLLGLGDSGFLAIPKPHELGFIFQTVPEVIYQAMLGNVETRNVARLAAEQLASTFGLSIIPQVISPLFETFVTNRSNLTGLPIVTEAMKNLPNELQYTSATSQIVKDVAAATGISPVQAEALIKGYTGQIGTTVFGLMDSMYRSATGRGVDKNWTQYPIVQKFLKDSSNTNPQGVADVYRLSGEIQGLTTALNTFMAQGSVDKARAIVEKNQGLFNLKPAISQLRTQLNTLSRNERMIVNNPNIPQDQKEEQIRQIREARRIIGKQMTDMIERTGK